MSEVQYHEQQFHEETIKTWHSNFEKILSGTTAEDWIEVLKENGTTILPGRAGQEE